VSLVKLYTFCSDVQTCSLVTFLDRNCGFPSKPMPTETSFCRTQNTGLRYKHDICVWHSSVYVWDSELTGCLHVHLLSHSMLCHWVGPLYQQIPKYGTKLSLVWCTW